MTVPGNEDEDEVEEMAKQTEEEIVSKSNWPRCSKCKRYMFMHDPGRGANCEMSVLDKDELEVHDRRILLKRLEKAKEAQRKDSLEEPVIIAEKEGSQTTHRPPEGDFQQPAPRPEPPRPEQTPTVTPAQTRSEGNAGHPGMFMNPMFMMNPMMMTNQFSNQNSNPMLMNPYI